MARFRTIGKQIPSDLEIAQAAKLRPIAEVGAALGVTADELEPYGRAVPLAG